MGSRRDCTWVLGLPGFRVENIEDADDSGTTRLRVHLERHGRRYPFNTTIKAVLRRARGMRDEQMLLLKLKWTTAHPIRSARDLARFLRPPGDVLKSVKNPKNLGLVRGIVVRSRSIVGNIGAALQTIVGGNITLYTELCEKARQDAFGLLLEHAAQLGANAVIGVRYDANEVAQGVTEVLAYGTAVRVERAN